MSETRLFKIPRSVLVVIHTPALEVLLIERADKPGYWQSVTGSLDANAPVPPGAAVASTPAGSSVPAAISSARQQRV